MSTDNSGDFMAGLFLGALLGAAAALLLAPAPGVDLRKRISERSKDVRIRAGGRTCTVEELSGAISNKGHVLIDRGRARLQEVVAEGRQAAARKKEELMAQLEEAQAAARPGAQPPTEIELT